MNTKWQVIKITEINNVGFVNMYLVIQQNQLNNHGYKMDIIKDQLTQKEAYNFRDVIKKLK